MLQNLINATVQPFRATPDTRFYFDHPSIESARQTILRAVIRAEGPVAVLGGSGYGKSLLADLVADQLCQRLDIVMLQSARLSSRRALLQSILFELKLPYLDLSEGELRLSILDRLEPSPETAPEGVLVLVDEAHTLHWKLLDELRLISNFTRNHQPRVKLVLFGNLRLEETLASPQLDSFNQRLAARCYLQPMSRSETNNYIQHQLRESGVDPTSVITQEAINSVYSASEGIPRLVNQLMDHAIWLASTSAQGPISAALVNDAWSDLQQLPTPWTSGKNDQPATQSMIEFGNLPDDENDHGELGFAPEKAADMSPQSVELPKTSGILTHYPDEPSPATTPTSLEIATTSGTSSDASTFLLPGTNSHEFEISPDANNFFAAFRTTSSSQFLDSIDDGSADDKWRVSAEPNRRFELEITLPVSNSEATVEVAAKSTPPGPGGHSGLNWFDSQPKAATLPASGQLDGGDEERIVSLMAEQQQYDAMGVWENDPPLSKPLDAQAVQSTPMTDNPNTLFGSDFDEEVLVSVDSPLGFQPKVILHSKSQSSDDSPLDKGTDYLNRMQQFADAITEASQNSDSTMSEKCNSSNPCSIVPSADSLLADSLWSIDVGPLAASTPNDRPLEDSIEDMVSKLNFSAFSMEPFSVEQIPLEPLSNSVPFDSMRRGNKDEVYLMHRPLNQASEPVEEHLDDDRDLLIIEEDIPVSLRTLDTRNNEQPAQKAASYSQLFSKLRK